MNMNVKVLDGGFGSQISRRVEKSIDGDALWSSRLLVTNPQAVVDTHLDFLEAGSDVISTNTYQASVSGFMTHLKITEQGSHELIKKAVSLAKEARSIHCSKNAGSIENLPLIAGSVGPYGACLLDGSEYSGSYGSKISNKELVAWHRPRIAALVEAGVDLLALETVPCRKEAELLVNLIREFPNVRAWLSFNCKNGKSLASGENFQDAVRHCHNLNPDQVVAFGANCVSPKIVEELFSGINEGREDPLPLLVYSNSGEIYDTIEGWCNKDKCEPVEAFVGKWLDMGVRWIGGCCRMYSDDIRKIRVEVQKWQKTHQNISTFYLISKRLLKTTAQ